MQTRSLPSYSLSKLFLISARYGVSSFTAGFSCARAPLDRVRLAGALYVERLPGAAHPLEEFPRGVDRNKFRRKSAERIQSSSCGNRLRNSGHCMRTGILFLSM